MFMLSNKRNNAIVGNSGEEKACEYLINNGYKILRRNFKTKIGEIDIIAKKDNTTVFVEVKCRQSAMFGLPRESVTPYKQRKIRQVATQYLKNHDGIYTSCRFDVIDILDGEITHIENCF